jgi:very-short-patch-repair endonuclease
MNQREKALRVWLRNHHGVIGRAEAFQLGAGETLIRAKVRRGEWEPVYWGVYRDTASPATPHQTLRAACVSVGPAAAASHQSAAWLWGVLDHPPAQPELTVPRPLQHGRHQREIKIRRSDDLSPTEITTRRGIPTTDALRTLVDLGAAVPPSVLADDIDRAVALKLVTILALMAELKRRGGRGRHGIGVLRRVLRDRGFLGVPNPSVLESRMMRLLRRHRLPTPDVELSTGPDGEYRLDFAYPDRRLAIEVDGYVWHFSPDHLQRDHARRNRLQAEGWRVLVYTWRDITQNPARVAAEVIGAHRAERAAAG